MIKICIVVSFLLLFEHVSNNNKLVCGNYYTSKPSSSQKKYLLEVFGKDYFKQAPSMMFMLNCDSTFKYGFCNKLISNFGTWRIKGEFLVLSRYLTKGTLYLFRNKEMFLFPYYEKYSSENIDTMYAILTTKGKFFTGKLSDNISPRPK